MKTKIRLHGKIAKIYGNEFEFANVQSASKCIDALNTVAPGIKDYIIEQAKQGMHYQVIIDDQELQPGQSIKKFNEVKVIDIAPCILGQKGWFEVILGAILVIGSFFTGGLLAVVMFSLGVDLILTGITYLTTDIPETEPDASRFQQTSIKNESFAFSSPVNTVAQGQPVPVGYGRLRIGTNVVSTSLTNYNLSDDRAQGYPETTRAQSILKLQEVFGASTSSVYKGY